MQPIVIDQIGPGAYVLDLVLDQNSDYFQLITFQQNEYPVDLTGYAAKWTAVSRSGALFHWDSSITLSQTVLGLITLDLPATVTSLLNTSDPPVSYDIILEPNGTFGGSTFRLIEGTVSINPGVSM